jgi:hypothetical protein
VEQLMPRIAAAATIVPLANPASGRPKPPKGLRLREQKLWTAIVGSMPPNWFTPAAQIILCRLIHLTVTAERLERTLRCEQWSQQHHQSAFNELQEHLMKLNKQILSLSGKLRLNPAARTDISLAATAIAQGQRASRPWEG